MDRDTLVEFVKNTEKTVIPGAVGGLHKRAEMLARLPLRLQRFVIEQGSKKDPFIGFVVEPYSFFLSYEIENLEKAESYLPPGYRIVPSAMFDQTQPRNCAVIGMFNVHTTVFWGSRVELYVIAENTDTGLLSWVICGYESNTISYDPGKGFSGPSTDHSVVTTSHRGEVVVDVAGSESPNRIALTANTKAGTHSSLNQRLWVEGNLSVDYGGDHVNADGNVPFALIFDPQEMETALSIPVDEVSIGHNTFGAGMVSANPFEAACFPYAQHFLTTSFPIVSSLGNEADLVRAIEAYNAKTQ